MLVLMWMAIGTYAMFGLYGVWLWIGDMRESRRREDARRRAHRKRIRA